MREKILQCGKCKHYYITWDKRFPNGCRAYKIKTRHMPSAEVLKATGRGCLCYEARGGQKR